MVALYYKNRQWDYHHAYADSSNVGAHHIKEAYSTSAYNMELKVWSLLLFY